MSVGDGALLGFESYLAVGRETTFGTYNTATAAMDFISAGLKTVKENKIIEQVEINRQYSKRIGLSKVIEGEIEAYAYAEQASFNYLLQLALGGTIVSATATGETAGGLAYEHVYSVGNMNQTYTSLCLNLRKGGSAGAKVFQYSGVRVNSAMFSAEIDDALKCNFALIAKDSTLTSNDVSSALSINTGEPLSFVSGRVSIVADTISAITSTAYWHVQSVEFGIANNLKSDSASRRIGSDTLDVLPPGIANFTLNVNMRFDTSTAYSAMLNGTRMAAVLEFQGSTLTGSVVKRAVKFEFPKLYVSDAGDPEIGGPDEVLQANIVFSVLREDNTTSGYAMRATVTNLQANYA
jgi:hypothetical protein